MNSSNTVGFLKGSFVIMDPVKASSSAEVGATCFLLDVSKRKSYASILVPPKT